MQHTKPTAKPAPARELLSLSDLAKILVRHYDIHEGLFDLSIEFQIGIGAVGPSPDAIVPGAMIGVQRVGLIPSTVFGPSTIDAAAVNPAKKTRKKKKLE